MTRLLVAALAFCVPLCVPAQSFAIEETTIGDIHAAMRNGTLSCRQLVSAYLRRIEAYDKNGPAINALVTLNPRALATADSMDRRFAREGLTGALHCIPVIVKDNFETYDLPTSAGSLALKDWQPDRDAFLVRRVRAAGGIVLAKSNMAEWAFSPLETLSSVLPGYTKNPYALDRVTAGSSGGTAAAVSANLGTVGLGTDTGNSIRGPSAHLALVGMRSTMGLTSRSGVVPLFESADVAGPMTRTVADNVAVFQAIVGEDPGDARTAASRGRPIPRYADSLSRDGLRGARVGVLRVAFESPTLDAEVARAFAGAVRDLRAAGATVIDTALVPGLDSIRRLQSGNCSPFKFDLEQYLASVASSNPPVRTIDDVLRSGRFHPTVQRRLEQARDVQETPSQSAGCAAREVSRSALRTAVTNLMDAQRLDALIYPTWSNPPRLIGDLNTPAGDNSQFFSPATGFPAITVPMGYTRGVLPAGLQLLGRPWAEGTLYRLAFAYESQTRHRHAPASAPPLRP